MGTDPFLFVIGAGTAGNACGRAVARTGRSVVAAERERVGGTCLWRGCMPKKALYNAARAYRSTGRLAQFGIDCEGVGFDWSAVLAWKWHAQETYAGDQDELAREAGIDVVKGTARFTGPDTVAVGDTEYRPEHVLVSTGAEPIVLDLPGAELADTATEALSYQTLPGSLVIVGSGFVAFEFAGIFASFGTKVTVLMRGDKPLKAIDPELVAIASHRLSSLGVEFVAGADTRSIGGEPGALTVEYTDAEGATQPLPAERVLMAVGRRPALDALDLATASVQLDPRGRPIVDEHLRTSNPRVRMAGDAAGGPQFTPVANVHGSAVAEALLTGLEPRVDVSYIPAAVFTAPQLAAVGMTEARAQAAGLDYLVKRSTFDYVGAAIIADERQGVVKVLVDDADRILGAHIAGPEASDLIYPYAVALEAGATSAEVAATRAIHPAFSEAVNWAAW